MDFERLVGYVSLCFFKGLVGTKILIVRKTFKSNRLVMHFSFGSLDTKNILNL